MEAPQDKNSLEAIAAAVGGVVLALAGLWRWIIGRSPKGMSPENQAILDDLREIREAQHEMEKLFQKLLVRIAVVETKIEKL